MPIHPFASLQSVSLSCLFLTYTETGRNSTRDMMKITRNLEDKRSFRS